MCKLGVNIGDVGILSIVVFVFDYFKRRKTLSESDSIFSQRMVGFSRTFLSSFRGILLRQADEHVPVFCICICVLFIFVLYCILEESFETGRRSCS